MNPIASFIPSFFETNRIVQDALDAIFKHDDGKILRCHCGTCTRLQTLRTAEPGIGYCDNHGPPSYEIECHTPPHVLALRRFNAVVYP